MRKYVIRHDTKGRGLVNYGDELNEEQRTVVYAGAGPILVIAGAGSGKTRTVTYRVARLMEAGILPGRIMLLTFTNRAAREMLGRVQTLLSSDVKHVWGGTFHSIANRLLRRHAVSIGYERNFSILDSEDSKDFIDTCIEESGIDTKARRFPKGEVLRDMFSLATNSDLVLGQVIAKQYPHFEPIADQIANVERLYRERKRDRNAMDYDDLLINWKRLMVEVRDASAIYQDQFQYILVDEYQDTNTLQGEIVDLLAAKHRNLMVVGDDAQSIFGWRGANVENIVRFPERYPDGETFRLETNYRSSPEILKLANASIANNRRQFPKHLTAVRQSQAGAPALVPVSNVDQQALFVASRILELREEGTALRDIAVLYRSHFHSLELQLELVRRGIPYDVRSGIRFFEQAHIKDVTSYLRILVNPRDEMAWRRVLRLIPGVGAATAARIWESFALSADPLDLICSGILTQALPRSVYDSWREFSALLGDLLDDGTVDSPSKQIEVVLERGYQDYVQTAFENWEARLEELEQLAHFAAQFKTTSDFLSELALINTERFAPPGATIGSDIGVRDDEDERLTLSSIHQAKGLEWKVVFLIWAADGRFPSSRSLRDPEGEEEERRLFYVALTRTKDELYVCYPLIENNRARQTLILRPSRFVTEVPRSLFEIWNVEEEFPTLTREDDDSKLIN